MSSVSDVSDNFITGLCIASFVVGILAGAVIGNKSTRSAFEDKCIEVGVAKLTIPTPTARVAEFVFITTNGLVKY